MLNRTAIFVALAVVALAAVGVYVLGRIYPYDTTKCGPFKENYPQQEYQPWSRRADSSW